MDYTNREVKEAIAKAIKTVEGLSKNNEFDPLSTAQSGDMWPKLTKEQRQMVVESLMPHGVIGNTPEK